MLPTAYDHNGFGVDDSFDDVCWQLLQVCGKHFQATVASESWIAKATQIERMSCDPSFACHLGRVEGLHTPSLNSSAMGIFHPGETLFFNDSTNNIAHEHMEKYRQANFNSLHFHQEQGEWYDPTSHPSNSL
jgi:hypothetical protein